MRRVRWKWSALDLMFSHELSLDSDIRYVKGVGPKRALLFDSLNIKTLSDLLNHFPFRIQDFSDLKPLEKVQPGEEVTVVGKVFSMGFVTSIRGSGLRVGITDGRGALFLVWYNMPYMKKAFRKGQVITASGKVEWRRNSLEMAHPFWREISYSTTAISPCSGPIIPVYHGTSTLPSQKIHSIIKGLLESGRPAIPDDLPFYIREKYGLLPLDDAYREIHLPKSKGLWEKARKTLGFREMLYLQIGLLLMKKENQKVKNPPKIDDFALSVKFAKTLPFSLTPAQERAISDIREDFLSGKAMNRLIQGDVGSGKTVVAMWALLAAVSSGYQGAFLVPTEVLAQQHLRTFEKLCADMGPFSPRVVLLSASLGSSERKRILEKIAQGEAQIVIGTHALLEPTVKWARLGLVITDEQHRFGVHQRLNLAEKAMAEKASLPHVLVMSATPIPRSLALTLFGDMDISVIDSMPKGRKTIITKVLSDAERKTAYDKVRDEISKGRQAYVVCPLIREGKTRRKSAEDLFLELKKGFLEGISVGLVHGDKPRQELCEDMARFVKGEISVLVSTTVIEVGIDVENATCMVVEDAESFGLATLHQLRGRVGRGSHDSFCFFITAPSDAASSREPFERNKGQRIMKLETLNDGFSVAEMDLKTRGPGEFFGRRQHGLTEFSMDDLSLSLETILQAREAATEVLNSKNQDCQKLLLEVEKRFGDLALKSFSR